MSGPVMRESKRHAEASEFYAQVNRDDTGRAA